MDELANELTKGFKLTDKQLEAQELAASDATHLMFFGGSRSGKTFLHVRNVVFRALKAPGSRHCILRFRFNHIKSAIVFDTFPKVMRIAFPEVQYKLNKTDWFITLNPGTAYESEIWFGGLDDKERTEKILGNEYVTIYLNECSQISWNSRNIVVTRLAQLVKTFMKNRPPGTLKPRIYYDCNPPNKGHWTYVLFILKLDPETKQPLANPEDYASFRMNPEDNLENLSDGYLETLQGLSGRLQKRFIRGEFADANPNALFPDDVIEKWRHMDGELPQMIKIVVGVDPSGSDDEDNENNDDIGIIVGGLGIDGCAYLLEDCTVNAGPGTWGKVATDAYNRHEANLIVGETNFGGGMVQYVIQTCQPRTPFRKVTASRGKTVRAEPFSALYEQGKIRHAGVFLKLEDELSSFSTMGYLGDRSPNRADAWIWVLTDLFPGIIGSKKQQRVATPIPTVTHLGSRHG